MLNDVANNRVCPDWTNDTHPATRQFFHDLGVGRRIQSQTAILLRYVGTEQPEFLQALDDGMRVFIFVFQFAGDRDHFTLDELPNAVHDLVLHFVGLRHVGLQGDCSKRLTLTS